MRRRLASVLAFGMVFALVPSAHDVITTPITFSREISRLVYRRCAQCHRARGMAFPLMTYAQARPWATAIKEEVLERRMPPWGAVKGFGEFKDDQGLTQEQIELIAEWVEGGAPEGDPKLLPPVPESRNEAIRLPPGTAVEGSVRLTGAITLTGIRPGTVPEGASLMVTANKPDGAVEPLLWLYNYKPKFGHPYWFSAPLRLPRGTRVEVSPAQAGSVVLLSRLN